MTFGFFLGPQPRLGLGLGRRFRPKVGFWRCLAISCTCAGQGAAPCSPYRNYSRNPSSFSVNLGFWYTFQVDLICLLGGFRRWCRELQNHMQLSMSIELYFFFLKQKMIKIFLPVSLLILCKFGGMASGWTSWSISKWKREERRVGWSARLGIILTIIFLIQLTETSWYPFLLKNLGTAWRGK